MHLRLIFISSCFIIFLATDISHAAGIIYRVQEMKAMKQRQYQEYLKSQQPGGQSQDQGTANSEQSYQQTVDSRNKAIAQAILAAHSTSVSNEAEPAGNEEAPLQSSGTGLIQQVQPASPSTSASVEDEADLSDVWKKLDKKSTVWTLLIDDQAKVLTVSEYIDRFHKQGVKINEPPEHYVKLIDQIVGANPQMLQRPFGELVQIVAIVDYDFDNGIDKDTLARKVLGDAAFEANKRRFTK